MMLSAAAPWSGYVGPPRKAKMTADGSSQNAGSITQPQCDILVALIGPVGCGKSAFIAKAIGTADQAIGHELCPGSYTRDIVTTRYKVGNSSDVVLVDTPGFGDINLTEIQILHKISKWLHQTYKKKVFFSVILCFQPINDNRIRWASWSKPHLLHELCGNDAKAQIALVTTMWDVVEERLGIERLMELKELWKPKFGRGSKTFCYQNTRESGEELLRAVVNGSMNSGTLVRRTPVFETGCTTDGINNLQIWNDDGVDPKRTDTDLASLYTYDGEPQEDETIDPL